MSQGWKRAVGLVALVLPVLLVESVSRAGAYDYRAVKLFDSIGLAAGAYGVGLGKQYGVHSVGNVNNNLHATVWSGQTDSYSDLGPGWVNDALGSSFAGSVSARARLWNSPTSFVDLHPAGSSGSVATGLAPGLQAGYSHLPSPSFARHAVLWRGTAASVVDLHPAGYTDSQANATSASQQVGYVVRPNDSKTRAAVWGGSAGAFADLHPASGYVASEALGVSRGRQVGVGYVNEQSSRAQTRALMWTGTAGSVVDLSPAGYVSSRATRIVGDWVVGDGVDAGGRRHALMWDLSVSPAKVIDLQPAAEAAGVPGATPWNLSSSGDVVGVEIKQVTSGATTSWVYTPVYWTPLTPRIPGDTDLDGRVSFTDYQILERNFGSADSYWKTGDFNDDRVTDWADFRLLLDHFGQTVGGAALDVTAEERAVVEGFGEAIVPEPGVVGLGAGLVVLGLGRRWRR